MDFIRTVPAETAEDIIVIIISNNDGRLIILSIVDRISNLLFLPYDFAFLFLFTFAELGRSLATLGVLIFTGSLVWFILLFFFVRGYSCIRLLFVLLNYYWSHCVGLRQAINLDVVILSRNHLILRVNPNIVVLVKVLGLLGIQLKVFTARTFSFLFDFIEIVRLAPVFNIPLYTC